MTNLIFSLNATMPLFLMMVAGWLLKKYNWLNDDTVEKLNRIVFRIFLPCLLFEDLYDKDFVAMWDGSFVAFCFGVTAVSILVTMLFSKVFGREDRGEFIQASYRSAAATLGLAFMTNIYDDSSMMGLMILGSVPLYNIVAVIVLSLTAQDASEMSANKDMAGLMKKTLKNLVTNPIILSIIIGMAWSLLKLPLPTIAETSINYMGRMASPLTLIALGASFEFKDLKEKALPVVAICFNKLILWCAAFLPLAVYMGFRNEKLVAALIMLGSGTTSSSYVMARNMGHNGVISSSAVMITTLLSSFTFATWLFVLKSLGYI